MRIGRQYNPRSQINHVLEGDMSLCRELKTTEFKNGVFVSNKDVLTFDYTGQSLCINCVGVLDEKYLNKKDTKVIAAFNGTGKSTLKEHLEILEYSVLDIDSMLYTWINPLEHENKRIRNSNFPKNMLSVIETNYGKVDYILITTYDNVRKGLIERNIPYTLVYPDISHKDYYLKLYKERNSWPSFIENINNNWESFIQNMNEDPTPDKIVLPLGKYLSDIFISEILPYKRPLMSYYEELSSNKEGEIPIAEALVALIEEVQGVDLSPEDKLKEIENYKSLTKKELEDEFDWWFDMSLK